MPYPLDSGVLIPGFVAVLSCVTRKVDNALTRKVDAARGWQVLIPVARGADLLLLLALRTLRSPDLRRYTLHPTPYTLHPTPYTLHPTPYTLHPTPYTLHPTPHTLHPTPHTLQPIPYTLHPTPYTLHLPEVLVRRGKEGWCGFEAVITPLVGSVCLVFLAKPETRRPKPENRNPKPEN